jgi:molybdopterin molybdotransferase
MGTEFLKIKESYEAKEIIKKLFDDLYKPKPIKISIDESYKRVTYKDIFAQVDLPPFDRTLKDGFALKAKDSFEATEESPKFLKCIDSIEAGSFSKKTIEKGECIEISTGAPIPNGADSIIMVEFSEKIGDKIAILKNVAPGQDIAFKGSDIKKDNLLLKKKSLLTPDKIGVISAQGIEKIDVFKKPSVGVISTGNELLRTNDKMTYGKIYDVNTNAVKNAIISCGGKGITKGIVEDDYHQLKERIENSLNDCDIVVCSGGTSAGVGDVLRNVLEDIGEVVIHGISIKPGKPTIIGKVRNKLVIGLPGNPVSALIIFYIFIAPNIRVLAGLHEIEENKIVKYPLAKRIHSSKGRIHYILVKIEKNEVYPIIKDSGAIASLSYADGYIKIPKGIELIDKNEIVKVNLF